MVLRGLCVWVYGVLDMTMSAEMARERAAQLLEMSLEASQNGVSELADILADAASGYLDRAEQLERQIPLLRQDSDSAIVNGSTRLNQRDNGTPRSTSRRAGNVSVVASVLTLRPRHKG